MAGSDPSTQLAAAMIQYRIDRVSFLPAELFAEPGWDLLLHLFVADTEGYRLIARTVCERSKIAPSVMARWLMHLSKIGYVVGDGTGDIDDLLTLSGVAMDRMEAALAHAGKLQSGLERINSAKDRHQS